LEGGVAGQERKREIERTVSIKIVTRDKGERNWGGRQVDIFLPILALEGVR
jgi:hypothetical protein